MESRRTIRRRRVHGPGVMIDASMAHFVRRNRTVESMQSVANKKASISEGVRNKRNGRSSAAHDGTRLAPQPSVTRINNDIESAPIKYSYSRTGLEIETYVRAVCSVPKANTLHIMAQ